MSTAYRPADEDGIGRLPCGWLYDDLLEQVADRLEPVDPAHQAICPHCRAALAELDNLWSPLHGWVESDDVAAPESLTRNIMERVTAMAQNTWHALVVVNPGVNRIASWVVALIARRAGLTVPGVADIRGRAEPSEHPADVLTGQLGIYFARPAPTPVQRLHAAGTGVAGSRVVINLLVTADGTVPLPVLAHGIRRAVVEHMLALTGLNVIEVNLEFTDVDLGDQSHDRDDRSAPVSY